jgi:hypothetical protein
MPPRAMAFLIEVSPFGYHPHLVSTIGKGKAP